MVTLFQKSLLLGTVALFLSAIGINAQAPYRVAKPYEDSVRIAIIWNNPTGNSCTNASLHQPVGQKTRDFVLKALDTTRVANIKHLINTTSDQVSWNEIEALWGATRLPHVIVHVNAGWSTGWNTATLEATLKTAVNRKVGVVSIGDDAASLADVTFGFNGVENVPAPLGDATNIDSLWIGMIRANDNRTKVYEAGVLTYPGVNGIISNAIDSVMGGNQIMQFLPRNNGRCQADADRYAIQYPGWLTMLGYQQGYIGSSAQPPRTNDLNVIVAIQDTLPDLTIRRAVALSFQPQFLKNVTASQQIVYDAVMFASLAHTLSVPTAIVINTNDTTLVAGDTLSLRAFLIDQKGKLIQDATITSKISWKILPLSSSEDRIVGPAYGDSIRFTAIEAYRTISIAAEYIQNGKKIADTAKITIVPGPAHHLVIEGSGTPRHYLDNPIGGNGSVTIGSAQIEARGYAVLRDRLQNFVSYSTTTAWTPLTPPGIVTAKVGLANQGEGIITKISSGITYVRAINTTNNMSDTVKVTVENISYDSLRIMVYDVNLGRLVKINSLTMRITDSTVLYVQGLRTDRLGPAGSLGWVDVSGIWTITNATLVNNMPSSSGQNSWSFKASNTGTGTITVRLTGGPQTSIPLVVNVGLATSLVLYPSAGNPGLTAAHPPATQIADTLTAGVTYTRLVAKLFDSKNNWLSAYETDPVLARQIVWTVTPTTEATFSSPTGYSNTFTSTRAYTTYLIKATMNNITDSMRVYVKSGPAHHLVIEESGTIKNLNNDDPLPQLTIRSEQTIDYVYAILRDRFGNFVGYSRPTKWLSKDTNIVLTDTALVALGEGYVLRNADAGITNIIATDITTNLRDTLRVEVQNIFYRQLRIFTLDNGKKYIDTIRVHIDESLTLHAEGRRSDNDIWEDVAVQWKVRGNLVTKGAIPVSANQWTVIPDSIGQGIISVSMLSAIQDSVFAFFIEGLPGKIAIYKELGDPRTMHPYPILPNIDTIEAGSTAQFVAKIFDRNQIWLKSYENSAISSSLISWSISRVSGPGTPDTLTSLRGHQSSFSPTKAYNTYLITTQFSQNTIKMSAQVQIYVKPAAPHHLVIEATSDITSGIGLIENQPIASIEFGTKDTIKNAFAILRDQFGNFAQHSTSTDWFSLDPLIAKAAEGVSLVGEGNVTRSGPLGSTKVVAVNRLNNSFRDTVDIKLGTFSYDSLRIVVKDSLRIESLVMRSDEDTTLQVLGKRSYDGVWVPVSGDWRYVSTNNVMNMPSSHAWDFAPGDSGTGKIIVSLGGTTPDTITVKINPGLPTKLAIYPSTGNPSTSNVPYPDPITSITAVAGTQFPLVAKIFDHKNVWLGQYELQPNSNFIHWIKREIPGTDSSGFLDDTSGHKRSFMPVRAFQSVVIVANLVTATNQILLDTVQLNIVAGLPKQLVIEGSPNWESSKNKANPISAVEITDSMTNARAYAVLRDSIGNFVKFSNPTVWGVVNDDTIITIRNGTVSIGEGIIQRILREGEAKVYAIDNTLGFRDTLDVRLLPYFYKALRIMSGNTQIQSLEMNTNQDTTLLVQGLRSDSLTWVTIPAQWENRSNLKITPSAPGWENKWSFSPSDTGSGWIRVTLGNDSVTTPDSITVKFTIGPPVEIKISILTPPEKRIAGEPINYLVEIYNKDGRVPGIHCLENIQYSDALSNGNRSNKPFVIVNNDTLWLSENGGQCFNSGVDTIQTVLYYAPYDTATTDSMHRISVKAGNLSGSTPPFTLRPAKLDALALERQNGTPIGDTLVLHYPGDQVLIYAVGYDKYGNKRGPEHSDWNTDSTLHPISKGTNTERIFYDASNVTDNESGKVFAIPADSTIKNISANTFIKIVGPLAEMVSAITRDQNGNGFLDQIELHYSKAVLLPTDFISNYNLKIEDDISFEAESVIGVNGQTSSIWLITLKEEATPQPQTSWTPVISYDRIEIQGINAVTRHKSVDGAGPVIWKVTKKIVVLGDRTLDEISVEFSEAVKQPKQARPLALSDEPSVIFNVWTRDLVDTTKFFLVEKYLAGINGFATVDNATVMFKTVNGIDISSRHYFNIIVSSTTESGSNSFISDAIGSGNYPNLQNRKVAVKVLVPATTEIIIGPVPASATPSRVAPGVLNAFHEPSARQWVRDDHAGMVFSVKVIIPSAEDRKTVKAECYLKIYDVIGNQVWSIKSNDILEKLVKSSQNADSSVVDFDSYWNGYNSKGMKVAPGVYKVIMYINYFGRNSQNYPNTKLIGKAGIEIGNNGTKVRK